VLRRVSRPARCVVTQPEQVAEVEVGPRFDQQARQLSTPPDDLSVIADEVDAAHARAPRKYVVRSRLQLHLQTLMLLRG